MKKIRFEISDGVCFWFCLSGIIALFVTGALSIAYFGGRDPRAESFVQENNGIVKILHVGTEVAFVEGTTNNERKKIPLYNKIAIPGDLWTIKDNSGYLFLIENVKHSVEE